MRQATQLPALPEHQILGSTADGWAIVCFAHNSEVVEVLWCEQCEGYTRRDHDAAKHQEREIARYSRQSKR